MKRKNVSPVTNVSMNYDPCGERGLRHVIRTYRECCKDEDPVLQLCADLEGYVIKVMQDHFAAYMPMYFDDMYEEAMLEIIRHADKYDPKSGTKTTYFATRILHAMFAWISTNVMMSTTYYASAEIAINRKLGDRGGTDSLTPEQVYDMLGGKIPMITIRRVLQMKRERREAKHYAIESGAWTDVPYQESTPKYYKPEEYVEQVILCEQLLGYVCALDAEDRAIIEDYFGFNGVPVKASILAERYGVTQYYMMKRITGILMKLRLAMTGSCDVATV